MYKIFFSALFSLSIIYLQAQSDWGDVYQIFQARCIGCHNPAQPSGGLDLEGSGPQQQKMQQVYQSLFERVPDNSVAAGRGMKLVYPGRPDKSFLFTKINHGLEPAISLQAGEGDLMPLFDQGLPETDRELIRQWILYGARNAGQHADKAAIAAFYAGDGQASFPAGAPAAPSAEEGFQVKMGPFYLSPTGELEYFQKYELELPEDLEVARIDFFIGTYSHHFLLYDFEPGGDRAIPHGLREHAFHQDISLVAAVQSSTSLKLPGNTAFYWERGIVLDLNSHYINYSANLAYQAEAYINVYTQPKGTARHQMMTALLPKTDIYIPNNGQLITFEQSIVVPGAGEFFIWALGGHTHQYGRSYKIFRRNPNGSKGEQLYDASCPAGKPGCAAPYFNYQHIPVAYYEPLEPVLMRDGLIHQASYRNDGPEPVSWGPTSEDEMMLMVAMFVTDTTGITTPLTMTPIQAQSLELAPNPASSYLDIRLPDGLSHEALVQIWSADGRLRQQSPLSVLTGGRWPLHELPDGVYIVRVLDTGTGISATGKVILLR